MSRSFPIINNKDIKSFNDLAKDNIFSVVQEEISKLTIVFSDLISFNLKNIQSDEIFKRISTMGKIIPYMGYVKYFLILDDGCFFITINNRYPSKNVYIDANLTDNKLFLKYKKAFNDLFEDFKSDSESIFCIINWWYSTKSDIDYQTVLEELDDVIHKEAYPYIQNFDEFINSYVNGKEQALILMGSPGTGKTRLIRYIIKCIAKNKEEKSVESKFDFQSCKSNYLPPDDSSNNARSNIIYTIDSNALSSDEMFINFLNGEYEAMVLEDIDFDLKDRKNGNVNMYKILASSDGFMRNNNKKIIISTNIQNTKDIDEALIRPGRCFAIIQTRHLDNCEAKKLMKVIGGNPSLITEDKMTVADVYKTASGNYNKIEIKKIGF